MEGGESGYVAQNVLQKTNTPVLEVPIAMQSTFMHPNNYLVGTHLFLPQ